MQRNVATDTQSAPKSAGRGAIALPADCTIGAIGVLHECLRTAGRGDSLDGSTVQRIDTAGLRLLVAFMHERRAAGSTIAWRGTSKVLSEAARKVGLVEAIRLPSSRDAAVFRNSLGDPASI
ncbi:MAG TPA: STAS domain-containing protein [Steroidobacteraceae bacterium]|nr:STAS domain-containing protein [Steroidobacteraceae bacterium]